MTHTLQIGLTILKHTKTYWKILKRFVKGNKIPMIPPLVVSNQLFTDFLVKENLLNGYFSQQCLTIDNKSLITANIAFEVEEKLCLDPNKVHGHDEISIHMTKTCVSSISKPLMIIFRNCFENERFPKKWKKANTVPLHIKTKKQLIKYYRPDHYCLSVLKFLKN